MASATEECCSTATWVNPGLRFQAKARGQTCSNASGEPGDFTHRREAWCVGRLGLLHELDAPELQLTRAGKER